MADAAPSPVICVTCQRPFPPGLTQKESPRYFAQYHLLPTAEDDIYFGHEAETILGYMQKPSAQRETITDTSARYPPSLAICSCPN